MKRIGFLIFFVALANIIFAQADVIIIEEERSSTKGHANALVVAFPHSSIKGVGKLWQKYIKQYKGKVKYDRKSSEYFADDAVVKDMSENTVDIVAKTYAKGGEGTELAVWFNLGVTYLSSKEHPERYPSAELLIKKFSDLVVADVIVAQLKEEKKKLKDLNKALKKLDKVKGKEDRKIAQQKKKIAKAEAVISSSEKKINANMDKENKQNSEIKEQEKVIETMEIKLKEIKT